MTLEQLVHHLQEYLLNQNVKLTKDVIELLPKPAFYRVLVGRLLYLTITRPNISYSVQLLSQFTESPRIPSLDAAHKVLRYIERAPS